ncbi:MAG: hypothetical protein PHV82_11650 [Victivallaceae bacterium]|nr:hypothetical protein [Victivallaceae bacterium]
MSPAYYQSYFSNPIISEVKDESLDEFVSQRSKILKSKLDVLIQEILIRLGIKSNNLQKLETDLSKVHSEMSGLSSRAYFHGDTTGKEEFQQLRQTELELEKEKREQDVSCWNDVVKVMHEVLNTWEAHQQSAARARLLNHQGIDSLLEELEAASND